MSEEDEKLYQDMVDYIRGMLEHSDAKFRGRRSAYCDKQYCKGMELLARAGIEYNGLPRIADGEMRGNGL